MRALLPLLGWAILLGSVGAIYTSSQTFDATDDEEGLREIYYAVGRSGEMTVRLLAGEQKLHMVAHLETQDPGTVDEATTWVFGMQASIEVPGREPIVREHWMRSRRSLSAAGGPSIRAVRPGTVITDSRILDLEPGHLVPEGGVLRIRPILEQPHQRLLVRIYRERQAEPLESTRIQNSAEKHVPRMAGIYPFHWPNLRAEERQRVSGWVRERLATLDLRGDSVTLVRQGGPSALPTASDSGYRLAGGEATVVNLKGPCTLAVDTSLESPPPGRKDLRIPLMPELVDASPRPFRNVTLDPYRVTVPDGALWSLRYFNAWNNPPLRFQLTLSPPAGQSWGQPPGAGGEQALAPETRRITVFAADLGLPPILVPVATGAEVGSIAVEARPRPDEAWLANPTADLPQKDVTVTFSAYDEVGKFLGNGRFIVPFHYTPYERYVERAQTRMSDEIRVHLFHTYRAYTMAFTADGPVDLRFLVPLGVEPVQAPEYAVPEGWRARYAPWELAPYVSITPTNLADLMAAGRLVRFDATVRIEPWEEGGASVASRLRTRVATPLGSPPRYPLVERFTSPYAAWQSWHRTRITPTTTLEIPGNRTLEVEYRVPSSQVGQTVYMRCGDVEARDLLIATGGTLELRGFKPGTQVCTTNAPPGEYLARAQGSGERWARRTVYRGDGTTLKVPIPVDRGRQVTVLVRAYAPPWAPPPTLRMEVDNGTPKRHGGAALVYTRGVRTAQPASTRSGAWLEDLEQGTLTAYEGMKVVLGDDLLPGEHTVSVSAVFQEGTRSYPVYLRFDATDAYTSESAPENWSSRSTCEMVEFQDTP